MTTSIKVLKKITPPLLWEPEQGEFTQEFLSSKSDDPNGPSYEELTIGDDSVLHEAQKILGRCLPPSLPSGRETGLVVGYVQSGKTMSFETVISLARDNNYGMVIVFAGTKKNLREQSEERLKKDLGINDGYNWYPYSNPTKGLSGQIEDRLDSWVKRPKKKKAILITVLKQVNHLENLAVLLKELPLEGIPVLIIDDESDQASLNTKAAKIRTAKTNSDDKSTTYDRICVVRDMVPHHSFLQYTATPQANLLLSQTDLLNPSFAELVTPGDSYTGGKAFFKDSSGLVIDIPTIEVPSKSNTVTASPKSLLSALRYFLLVAAHHSLTKVKGKDRNRSMMVHPAMQTSSHKEYKDWMDKSFKTLKAFIQKQHQNAPLNIELHFKKEYELLNNTFPGLKPLKELINSMIEDVLDDISIVQINGTPDAEKKVDWKATPYWILVGGAKLDRGYTVEGLAITYMPRPLGSSPAADTLQQRARFFGYKKAYLGLCRVFVQPDVRIAFTDYVEHEEFIRSALINNRGKPLRDWRRDFLLVSLLNPTRPNVIGLNTRRIPMDGWLVPRALQRDSVAVEFNRNLLEKLQKDWLPRFGPIVNAAKYPQFKGTKGVASPNFLLESVPLIVVLEEFLLNVQIKDPTDAEEHSALLIGIATLLAKNSELKVDVFLMNNLVPQYRTRDAGRGFPAGHPNAPINQYFSNSADSVNDKSFLFSDRLSLHLRKFNLGTTPRTPSSADILDVTWFAMNIPKVFKADLHIESRE